MKIYDVAVIGGGAAGVMATIRTVLNNVAGDLRANLKKQIYTAWDTAVDSADEINILIRRKKRSEHLL